MPKKALNIRLPFRCRTIVLVAAICLCCNVPALASDTDTQLWKALQSGSHMALLRHAIAPGTGDPPEFELRQCATQRNLSQEGRDQAAKIGDRFRENEIHSAQVFSSQWCRCLETAKLLALGPVRELPALNSFFEYYDRQASQTRVLLEWIERQNLSRPLVLVTHQVNITALTGIYPESGELVIVHRTNTGDIRIIGTIKTR
jgi:phosphohistidine phosphatase SixA